MGEIKDFVELYIKDSNILEDTVDDISTDLKYNIQKQLYHGHGYDKGRLHDSITVDTRVYDNHALITATYEAKHGIYVLLGIRGKGKAKCGPIDFLGDGLKETIAKYGG